MKEGLIKDTFELILKEIQSIFTVVYLIAIGIGMLFNYQKYSEFGINIFDYADVFDFLIAPFSDFHILLFTILSVVFVLILFKIDSFGQKKWPKLYTKTNFGLNKKSWFNIYRFAVFSFSFIVYLFIVADSYGKYSKSKIEDMPATSIRMVDNDVLSGKLIGKTKDVVFLLTQNEVKAIPITALVKEIRIKDVTTVEEAQSDE